MSAATDYVEAGLALVPLRPGTKQPLNANWTLKENAVTTIAQAEKLNGGLGLAHAWSGTCAFDIDDFFATIDWFQAHGIDVAALLQHPAAVRIDSGRQNRAKLVYRLPDGVATPLTIKHLMPSGATMFELRCADSSGNSVHCVLPPSIHPDTGKPYCWVGDWHKIPVIPEELLSVWSGLIANHQRHTGDRPKAVSPEDLSDQTLIDLDSALAAISSDSRETWISVGHALKGLGEYGYQLWLAWSQKSSSYRPGDEDRWNSFDTKHTDYRAIFGRAARDHAWVNPGYRWEDSPQRPVAPVMRYELLSDADLCKLPPPQWRIKKVLPETGLAAVFGASGSGKSFAVIDMTQSMAAGRDWFGYKTKACNVLYCALEGEGGIAGRVSAYRIRHGATSHNIRYLVQPFSLLERGDISGLAQAIKANGQSAEVVILDTLNRAAPGADENDSRSMGQIIAAAKGLQALVGGLVMLVHHTGKDTSKGLRGHSSLHAALDVAIEVRRDGDRREWLIAKSREGEDGEEHPFKLDIVELGTDEDGEPITSCVVHPLWKSSVTLRRPMPPKSGNQRIAWDTLGEIFRKAGNVKPEGAPDTLPQGRPCITLEAAIEQTRTRLVCDPKRQTERAQAAIRGLVERGLLCHEAGFVWCK